MYQATDPFSKRPAVQPKNSLSSPIKIPHFRSEQFAAHFKIRSKNHLVRNRANGPDRFHMTFNYTHVMYSLCNDYYATAFRNFHSHTVISAAQSMMSLNGDHPRSCRDRQERFRLMPLS